MTTDLLYKMALELKDLIAREEVSPIEVLDHTLARMADLFFDGVVGPAKPCRRERP